MKSELLLLFWEYAWTSSDPVFRSSYCVSGGPYPRNSYALPVGQNSYPVKESYNEVMSNPERVG